MLCKQTSEKKRKISNVVMSVPHSFLSVQPNKKISLARTKFLSGKIHAHTLCYKLFFFERTLLILFKAIFYQFLYVFFVSGFILVLFLLK